MISSIDLIGYGVEFLLHRLLSLVLLRKRHICITALAIVVLAMLALWSGSVAFDLTLPAKTTSLQAPLRQPKHGLLATDTSNEDRTISGGTGRIPTPDLEEMVAGIVSRDMLSKHQLIHDTAIKQRCTEEDEKYGAILAARGRDG